MIFKVVPPFIGDPDTPQSLEPINHFFSVVFFMSFGRSIISLLGHVWAVVCQQRPCAPPSPPTRCVRNPKRLAAVPTVFFRVVVNTFFPRRLYLPCLLCLGVADLFFFTPLASPRIE